MVVICGGGFVLYNARRAVTLPAATADLHCSKGAKIGVVCGDFDVPCPTLEDCPTTWYAESRRLVVRRNRTERCEQNCIKDLMPSVVGMPFKDAEASVKLLQQDHPRQFVRQSNLAE